MTLSVKEQLNAYILNGLRQNKIKGCACVELILEIIERNTIPCNPGILGSGILTANLSKDSNTILQDYKMCIRDRNRKAQSAILVNPITFVRRAGFSSR